MLIENVALEDFASIAVKLEHAGVKRQHVLGCRFSGAGGDAAGNRLHVCRQILGFRSSVRTCKRDERRRHASEASEKKIKAHGVPPRASTHLDAQSLRFLPFEVLRMGG